MQAKGAFVMGKVILDMIALQVFATLAAVEVPDEARLAVVAQSVDNNERIASSPVGLVEGDRSRPPGGGFQGVFVQQYLNPLEHFSLAHTSFSF